MYRGRERVVGNRNIWMRCLIGWKMAVMLKMEKKLKKRIGTK